MAEMKKTKNVMEEIESKKTALVKVLKALIELQTKRKKDGKCHGKDCGI